MTVGISIWPAADAGNTVESLLSRTREAADAGVRSIWYSQLLSYDAILVATLAGRENPGINVGISVVPIFARHPLLVASQAQTAQAATGGRFTLGLGTGAKLLSEPGFGVPFERPVARLREFLTVVQSVFETGEVDFTGETVHAKSVLPTKVAGADRVPVLVAAMGPQALRVTGELADGTLPFLAGPRALSEHIVPQLTKAAEGAGRPSPRVIAEVPVIVTSDVDTARARVEEATSFYDGIPSYQRSVSLSGVSRASELAIVGDEETVAAETKRYFEAGATEVVFTTTDLVGAESHARALKLAAELNAAR